jgi:large subunit ribosomal protein L29
MAKYKELLTKTPDELNEALFNSKRELMNLRFQIKSGNSKNTSRVKIVRRTIARIKTIENNKNRNRQGN